MISALKILLSGAAGAFVVWGLQYFVEKRRQRYDRRLYILRSLMANFANVVSFEFVSAFNMILLEYKVSSNVRHWHNEFIKNVNLPKVKTKDEQNRRSTEFNNILVKLIESIAKSIKIEIEQLDISNKVYWPQGFSDTAATQRKLTNLLIDNQETWKELLKKIKMSDMKLVVEAKHIVKKSIKKK